MISAKPTKWIALCLVALSIFMDACHDVTSLDSLKTAHDYNAKVFLKWNELFLDLDRYAKGYRPGPAPRALGYLGLAAYEATVTAIPENRSLEGQFAGLDVPDPVEQFEYHWPTVVNETYHYMMTRFFFHMENDYASLYQRIDLTRKQLNAEFAAEVSPEVLKRSEDYGRAVAKAVYDWSATDPVGHNAFLNPQPSTYVPPSNPGLWQPTFPDFSRAVFPQWGKARTFAVKEGELSARPPLPYSENENSLFYTQGLEVYNTIKNINENGPDAYEQRWVGEFWSDDILGLTFSPPSRLIAIANQVVEKEKLDLAGCAELYAKLGMAMNDTGVMIWFSKYKYNVERPVSYIRRVVSKKYPDAANWVSILNNPVAGFNGVTPAFPAYPSGHSGFGGTGGKVLSSFFEFNRTHPGTYTFTDNCHINRSEFIGKPRTYASFKDMADENAYSRIPLGVHFRMDCSEGLRQGELAAQRVLELPWKK
jgi:PAP2 superfamily